MNPKLMQAYKTGQALKEKSWEEIVYKDLVPEHYIWNDIYSLFFEAGYYGHDMPQWVRGWRYGDIPESGVSYNHRDDRPEAGTSLMAVCGGDETLDKVSAIFIRDGRDKVEVEGWLHYKKGSDGEPILVGAKMAK